MYYIGLDVHKKTISYCVKDAAGKIHREDKIGSTRRELDAWIKTLPQPRMMAMEATIFTGWIYDHLLPHAEKVKGCPSADAAGDCHGEEEERQDRCQQDRSPIVPALRLPARVPYGIDRDPGPPADAALSRTAVKQMVQMKNRISGLLMEKGVTHTKRRLHKVGYFAELMSESKEIDASIRPLLKLSREHIVRVIRRIASR
jgi:hypothetical protein